MLTVAVQGMNGNSAFSAQFCYEPKTAFKSKTNEKEKKKKNNEQNIIISTSEASLQVFQMSKDNFTDAGRILKLESIS